MFHINKDDKKIGWCPPTDNSGKIYVNSRRWTSDHQESKPTYDQAEHFLRCIDKCVSCAVDNHFFLQWSKSRRTKTVLDKVTALCIAYTFLVYENTKEVWEEDLQIKVSSKDDMEQRHATRHKNPSIMKEGESVSKSSEMVGQMMGKIITKNYWGSLRTSNQAMSGKHYKNIISEETLCKRS